MTEGNPTVEEARQAILDYTNDRWEALEPRLNDLIEAVRQEERERVTHEVENHRGWGKSCSLCASPDGA